ncbi:MAG: hypothetical protein KGH57_03825 [Candidatus Micrarchaeota archaeon]|nr:hypothetical protein [Candidatus Micrarchaeota archaeon]
MPSKYEQISEETVPAAKSIIARALILKHNMTETDAASYLGVAQAAISKYVTEKYSDSLKRRVAEIEAKINDKRELIDGYVKQIADGKGEYVNICICTICSISNGIFCAFSHMQADKAAAPISA